MAIPKGSHVTGHIGSEPMLQHPLILLSPPSLPSSKFIIMVFKSTRPNIHIPNQDIVNFIFGPNEFNNTFPHNREILIDGLTKRTITYAGLKSGLRRFGAGLQDKFNFKKGEVLAIYAPNQMYLCELPAKTTPSSSNSLPNQVDYSIPVFGTLAACGVVTCANPAYTATELMHQLHDSHARILITIPELLPTALEAASKANLRHDHILLFGGEQVDGFKPFEAIFTQREIEFPEGINAKEDIAFLSYSSGTTGLPKGVILTHSNIVSNVAQIVDLDKENMRPSDIWIGFIPFYHIYGLNNIVHIAAYLVSNPNIRILTHAINYSYYKGTPVVVMPRFDFETFLQHLQNYKVTIAMIVPPIALALAKSPIVDKYDLSSMRLFSSGAAPLSKELVEAVVKRINVGVRQGYGMTEASPATNILPWDKWNVYGTYSYHCSIGPLLANIEAKIVDENDNELGINQEGELLIRGPNVMKGYLNNPEATRKSITPDGFLRTGDVCRMDENGYFYIVDRVKELIKYKGFQVPPAELEAILLTNPLVADTAVIGVYSAADATELPRAYVVLPPGQKPSDKLAKEIEAFVAKGVAQHKRLRGGVRFVAEIPKSAAGKILRRYLRDQAEKEDKEAATKAKL
ncbi:hypothetical protein BC937DRAFT_95664 [Endogone sp. FLAS-F59071]|nr:hypothetical protein BC937DRAFT_95664 [Endogone sp. FLAS-F59071]|eukprot:RUS20226.1 hypothetical protein BC937DRAFT_95664 [Endogone sp. FLAS-F59071]